MNLNYYQTVSQTYQTFFKLYLNLDYNQIVDTGIKNFSNLNFEIKEKNEFNNLVNINFLIYFEKIFIIMW